MKILVFYSSLWEDLVEILVKCCQSLCVILSRSLWEALEEVLVKSSRCPYIISCRSLCEKILRRSCWNPSQEVLALRSWRSSALVLVSKGLLGYSCLKILWDPLYRLIDYIDLYRRSCCCSCDDVYKYKPDLSLFHSYCCWYASLTSYPAHCLGPLAGVIVFTTSNF